MKKPLRPIAVFLMKNYLKIPNFIIQMKAIAQNFETDTYGYFTASPPVPSVTDGKGVINRLEDAQTNVKARIPDAVAQRAIEHRNTLKLRDSWLAYVQSLANDAATPELSIAIIGAAGLTVRSNNRTEKPKLQAKNGYASGWVDLFAQALNRKDGRASYQWQMGDGDKVVDLPSTLQSRTTVKGLTPGQRVTFRFRYVTKKGEGTWSDFIVWVVQ